MRIRNLPFSMHAALIVLAALASALGGASCSVDNVPAGGLVVSLESDLAAPKDIDRVVLELSQGGRVFYSAEKLLGEGHELMPLQVRVSTPGNNNPVLVRAIALLGVQPRIERSVITPMPATWLASVRLPLNFLCTGKVTQTGESACGADMTCKQGECASATLAANQLVRYEPDLGSRSLPTAAAADGGMDAAVADSSLTSSGAERCFDVASCFYTTLDVQVEPVTCSFALPPEIIPAELNIALRLPLGQPGVCENGSCFVVLDADPEGYQIEAGRVYVPLAVCDRMRAGDSWSVALGLDCPKKNLDNPLCGPWTSIKTPVPTLGTPVDGSDPGISVGTRTGRPSQLQPSCSGVARQACGMCGTEARDCRDGAWTPWAACVTGGTCVAGASEMCPDGGKRICMGDCTWGPCMAPTTCVGDASRPCGNCGTQTRTCNAASGTWSDWSACGMQGECAPNATRACGTSGTQVCGGNCKWDPACTGQRCTGLGAQSCGMCGVQVRTCDTNTGMYPDWATAACSNQGECAANSSRACGSGGKQFCGADCRWQSGCGDQMCQGRAPRQDCGNCGSRSAVCDAATGMWSTTMFGDCAGEGCTPGQKQACGVDGTQTCTAACQWGTCACNPSTKPSESCGNCNKGTRTVTCNVMTGQWAAGTCTEPASSCVAGSTESCGGGRNRTCDASCTWSNCGCGAGEQYCASRNACEKESVSSCGPNCATCTAGAGQTAACVNHACTTQSRCTGGTRYCAAKDTCEAESASSCGSSCSACTAGAGETAVCNNHVCSTESKCTGGTHYCAASDKCETESVNSCGSSCTACKAGVGETAACQNHSCVTVPRCTGTMRYCAQKDTCEAESVSSCGPGCVTCTAGPGETAACVNHACVTQSRCTGGTRYCAAKDACEAESVSSCGPSCATCKAAGAGETVSCKDGMCVTTSSCTGGTRYCASKSMCEAESAASCGPSCVACKAAADEIASCESGMCTTKPRCTAGTRYCAARDACEPESATSCGSNCASCGPNEMCSGGQCSCKTGGCGASCTPCGENRVCSAANQCVCAADACGPSCVKCGANETCSSGQCVCKAGGCGASCTPCGENRVCSAANQCVCAADACGPNCVKCGANETCSSGQCVCKAGGCGSSCTPCGENRECSPNNQCICAANTCGSSCAVCRGGTTCIDGACVMPDAGVGGASP